MSAANITKPRILFVDDEQRVLNSMRVMFRRDYELHLTTRAQDALEIVTQQRIDVIVADQRMPEMSGVQVLSAVRTRSPRTVRILLTGYADLDAIEGSINDSEVFRFLTKPCAPEELRETIKLAVQIARTVKMPVPAATLAAGPEPISGEPAPQRSSRQTQPRGSDEGRFTLTVEETVPPGSPGAEILETLQTGMSAAPLPQEPHIEHDPLAETVPPASPSAEILESLEVGINAAVPSAESESNTAEEDPLEVTIPNIAEQDPLEETMPNLAEEFARALEDPLEKTIPDVRVAEAAAQAARLAAESHSDDDDEATTIVMEGDTITLVAPDGQLVAEPPPSGPRVGVLVFTTDDVMLTTVRDALRNRYPVVHASNIAHVVKVLGGANPGVMITDISDDPSVIEQMVGTLKQHLPELVTIVISEHRDTEGLVRLINFGQVFRFLRKPLSAAPCLVSVRAAANKHLLLREQPELLQRHVVEVDDEGRTKGTLIDTFLDRLKTVSRRWAGDQWN